MIILFVLLPPPDLASIINFSLQSEVSRFLNLLGADCLGNDAFEPSIQLFLVYHRQSKHTTNHFNLLLHDLIPSALVRVQLMLLFEQDQGFQV